LSNLFLDLVGQISPPRSRRLRARKNVPTPILTNLRMLVVPPNEKNSDLYSDFAPRTKCSVYIRESTERPSQQRTGGGHGPEFSSCRFVSIRGHQFFRDPRGPSLVPVSAGVLETARQANLGHFAAPRVSAFSSESTFCPHKYLISPFSPPLL
jgi:hypothetical protein